MNLNYIYTENIHIFQNHISVLSVLLITINANNDTINVAKINLILF